MPTPSFVHIPCLISILETRKCPAHLPRRKRAKARRSSLQEHTNKSIDWHTVAGCPHSQAVNQQASQGLGRNPAHAMHTVVCDDWQMSTSACREATGQPRTSSVTEIAGHWTGLTGSDAAHLLLSVLPATRGIPTVGFAESLSLVIPSTSPEPPVTWIIPVVPPTYDSQPQRTPYLSAQSRPFGIMYVTHKRSSQQTGVTGP